MSSSMVRQSSLQDITELLYGVTLALVWHYYIQRSQHYNTLGRYSSQREPHRSGMAEEETLDVNTLLPVRSFVLNCSCIST